MTARMRLFQMRALRYKFAQVALSDCANPILDMPFKQKARLREMFNPLSSIFFLSGGAALIYQVCWQRLLSVYYGSGTISSAIIVSVFMLGLGIGALIGGWLTRRNKNLIFAYVWIEASVGVFGLLSIAFLSYLGEATAGSSYGLTVLYTGLFLLIPTVLMGATLPVAVAIQSRWHASLLANISLYYFINTIGASVGALLCSYVLISFLGLDGAVFTALTINLLLACGVLAVALRGRSVGSPEPTPSSSADAGLSVPIGVPFLLFLNGFFAIGYQIVWYRAVGVILKDSVYSFSTVLSIYLLGIALGSLWIETRSGKVRANLEQYLVLNGLVGLTAIVPLLLLYASAAHWPLDRVLGYMSRFSIFPDFVPPVWDPAHLVHFLFTLSLCILVPVALLLLSSFFMGAAFPVGIALFSSRDRGGVAIGYFSTIAGNTLGGLFTSFVLLPFFGTVAVVVGFVAIQLAVLMFGWSIGPRRKPAFAIGVLACICFIALVAPGSADFYRRIHPQLPGKSFYQEGVEGVSMVYRNGEHMRVYINGSWHGYRPNYVTTHMTLEALTYAQAPRRVLVVGFGIGGVVRALLTDRRIESIDVVEINRTSVENLIASGGVRDSVEDPRIKFHFDDGRRYLQRNAAAFDVIAMDPLRSRSAFSNNIYSVEYFQLVKRNLAPNGIVIVWSDDTTGTIDKTIASVFEHVRRYRTFLVASNGDVQRDPAIYERDLANLSEDFVQQLRAADHDPACGRETILSTLPVEPNRDLKPRTEFYLGNLLRPLRFFTAAPCKGAAQAAR